MTVMMQMKVEWQKGHETLEQFKQRYDAFKAHVHRMQASGALPVGEILWLLKTSEAGHDPPKGVMIDREAYAIRAKMLTPERTQPTQVM
jgi:hypothetical protein